MDGWRSNTSWARKWKAMHLFLLTWFWLASLATVVFFLGKNVNKTKVLLILLSISNIRLLLCCFFAHQKNKNQPSLTYTLGFMVKSCLCFFPKFFLVSHIGTSAIFNDSYRSSILHVQCIHHAVRITLEKHCNNT